MISHHLETDLEKIKELGELRDDENQRFRAFLKNRNVHKTDLLVHRLNSEIAPHIDCTACGNCCRNLSPYLTKDDLKHLTDATRLPVEEVISTYTETDDYGLSLKHLPCCFLKENKCTIYQHRPETCSSFPHLDQPDFNSRARRTFDNYSICPIIFNVVERMKTEMQFE
jgi:uncharacterized protein